MSNICNRKGSREAPALRVDVVRETWLELPESIQLGDEKDYYRFFKDQGFSGIQNGDADTCREFGLSHTHSGKVDKKGDAARLIEQAKEYGSDCVTVHAGTGLEDDDEMDVLVDDILNASVKSAMPVFLETHRATITQDMWRTVRMVERFPEIRFNGDFSHWYTGQEMRYGRFAHMEKKFEFIQPVFDRVRFIHGRIGNGGCMQRDIMNPEMEVNIKYFREMWIRSLVGFLKEAQAGDYIIFAPELLGVTSHYAVTYWYQGELIQEGNRLKQAVQMKAIIEDCWVEARDRFSN